MVKVSKHYKLQLDVVEDFEEDVEYGNRSAKIEELLRGEGYGNE